MKGMHELSTSTSSVNVLDTKLSKSQGKYVKMTAKYLSLFFVAVISTSLGLAIFLLHVFGVLEFYIKETNDVIVVCIAIDCCVNVISAYLHYTFASKYYSKCCKCMDYCCTWMLTRKMEKSISDIKTKHKYRMHSNTSLSSNNTEIEME